MRRKQFMKYIFCISLSDFGVSVVSSFGFPPTSSPMCQIQGAAVDIFIISSWLWTISLTFHLWWLVHKVTPFPIPMWLLHLVCWGIPTVLSALVFSTNTFSNDGPQWCIISSDGRAPAWTTPFWAYTTFIVWLFVCVIILATLNLQIYRRMYQNEKSHSTLSIVFRATFDRVYLYPVAMLICWSLNVLTSVASIAGRQSPRLDELIFAGMVMGICYGPSTALIFFVKSAEAQRRWFDLIFANGVLAQKDSSDIPVDFLDESDCSSLVRPFIDTSSRASRSNAGSDNWDLSQGNRSSLSILKSAFSRNSTDSNY